MNNSTSFNIYKNDTSRVNDANASNALSNPADKFSTIQINIFGPAFAIQNVLGVGIVLANVSVLIVLSKCRVVDKSVHGLFRSLAVADLMMGIATFLRQSLLGFYGGNVEDVPLRCTPAIIMYILSGGCSVSTLLFVAFDQWYIASRPLNVEQKKRQKKRMDRCIRLSWIVWSCLALISLLATRPPGSFRKLEVPCLVSGPYIHTWYWQPLFYLICAQAIMTIIFQFLCLRTMSAAFRQLETIVEQRHQPFVIAWGENSQVNKDIKRNHYRLSTGHGNEVLSLPAADVKFRHSFGDPKLYGDIGETSGQTPFGDKYELNLAKKRMKLTKTLALVMLLFSVSWLLYLPPVTFLSLCQSSVCDMLKPKVAYLAILPVLNSLMNAVVYPLRIKTYRQTLLRLFCPWKFNKSRQIIPVSSNNMGTVGDLPFPPLG